MICRGFRAYEPNRARLPAFRVFASFKWNFIKPRFSRQMSHKVYTMQVDLLQIRFKPLWMQSIFCFSFSSYTQAFLLLSHLFKFEFCMLPTKPTMTTSPTETLLVKEIKCFVIWLISIHHWWFDIQKQLQKQIRA